MADKKSIRTNSNANDIRNLQTQALQQFTFQLASGELVTVRAHTQVEAAKILRSELYN